MYGQVQTKRVSSVKAGHIQVSSLSGGSYNKISVGGYASSVYAGAGGLGHRISTSSHYGGSGRDMPIMGNEKETMQILNNRLSTYLEKVRSLEKANSQLEAQIRDWYLENHGTNEREDSSYFQTIEELRKKIQDAKMENASILLQIDNARLAADDFKLKFESERALCASEEHDIYELRQYIDQLTITRADLETQIENLNEELVFLKKNHSEEMSELRKQANVNIEVEVDAIAPVDLAKLMDDMRAQYEQIIETHRKDAKYWFEKKVEEWNEEIHISTAEIETCKKELKELRRKKQDLEIESQTELSKKTAIATTLENVNTQASIRLVEVQEKIATIEAQLHQSRNEVAKQIFEFGLLFDLKTRLEAEIATYRSLLDGEEVKLNSTS